MSIYGYQFRTYGNAALANIVIDRLSTLGYKRDKYLDGNVKGRCGVKSAILLVTSTKIISFSENFEYKLDEWPLADCNKLFGTDDFLVKKNPIQVKLNNEYTAEVTDEMVTVGCQKFPVSKLNELVRAVEEYKKQ